MDALVVFVIRSCCEVVYLKDGDSVLVQKQGLDGIWGKVNYLFQQVVRDVPCAISYLGCKLESLGPLQRIVGYWAGSRDWVWRWRWRWRWWIRTGTTISTRGRRPWGWWLGRGACWTFVIKHSCEFESSQWNQLSGCTPTCGVTEHPEGHRGGWDLCHGQA